MNTKLSIASWLSGFAFVLTACQRSSDYADMRYEADAIVDGRPVHASTVWRTKFIQTFPSGANMPVSGYALAIPVAPGRYVYGLFRSIDENVLEGWGTLATGLDAFISSEDRQLGRRPMYSDSRASFRDYVVERLDGRRITFCLPRGTGLAGQDRCPLLMYFTQPNDWASAKLLRPGETVNIGGHEVRIRRVTLTFQKPGPEAPQSVHQLPLFRLPFDQPVGKLPLGLLDNGSRQLYGQDFRRDD